MNSKEIEFYFKHNGRKTTAHCTIHTLDKPADTLPYKYPLYRIILDTKVKSPRTYLFYKVSEGKFAGHPTDERFTGIAKELVNAMVEQNV